MLNVFDRMCGQYNFHVLNASRSVRSVAADLRPAVAKLLDEPTGPVPVGCRRQDCLPHAHSQVKTKTVPGKTT